MFIIEVLGKPIPQKQTQFIRATGIAYNPSKKDMEVFQWQTRPFCPKAPLTGPVSLDITFYFEVPKSASHVKKRQMLNQVIHHTKKPDVDNCGYFVTNALKGLAYKDDAQIIDLHLHKRYGDPEKTVIKIVSIEEMSPVRGDDVA